MTGDLEVKDLGVPRAKIGIPPIQSQKVRGFSITVYRGGQQK